MKTIILKILSLIIKVMIKAISDDELTELIEQIIKKDLDGDGMIGKVKDETTFLASKSIQNNTENITSIDNDPNNILLDRANNGVNQNNHDAGVILKKDYGRGE